MVTGLINALADLRFKRVGFTFAYIIAGKNIFIFFLEGSIEKSQLFPLTRLLFHVEANIIKIEFPVSVYG
jgi:hypothetical protein